MGGNFDAMAVSERADREPEHARHPMRPVAVPDDRTATDPAAIPTVLVSNRGPLSFHFDDDGLLVQGVAAGGLAGTLHPLLAGTGATWIASAVDDADRAAQKAGLMSVDGLLIDLVDIDPEMYRLAYDEVSNSTLWFCHHHLFESARQPRSDHQWRLAWDAYRDVNRAFALRVAQQAPEGARVLVQDYHLCLLGSMLRQARPDLVTVHFTHTPFADTPVLAMLPGPVVGELLDAMAGFDICGFHTLRWAGAYLACQAKLGRPGLDERPPPTFVSPLGTDPDVLTAELDDPAVAEGRRQLDEELGDPGRQVILRVDRMELSKNLLRGFWAFDELLEFEPHRRGRVTFLALAYPSRQGLDEYLSYQRDVEETVARVNARWGTPDWTPILLQVGDDYPRSLAALTRYDVLLVNPVRDGMNLVAKEGPMVNQRDGALVLSREAGAYAELAPGSLAINPFDVGATAAALSQALDLAAGERAAMAAALREIILARRPADWLHEQLLAAESVRRR